MPFSPGQFGVGGPQARRPLPFAPIAQQRPGAVPNGHRRAPVVPEFIRGFLPGHALARPPPASGRSASDFQLLPEDERELHYRLWEDLIRRLALVLPDNNPATVLLPSTPPMAPISRGTVDRRNAEIMLRLLLEHDLSLRETQEHISAEFGSTSSDPCTKVKASAGDSGPTLSTPRTPQHAPIGVEYLPMMRGVPCGHIIRKGEAFYRCRHCGHDDSCVQCATCFNASNHEGHDIIFAIANDNNGCCDCGDPEAWNRPLGCHFHELPPASQSQSTESFETNSQRESLDGMSMDTDARVPEKPEVEHSKLLERVHPEVLKVIQNHFARAIDMIVDTLEQHPDRVGVPTSSDAVEKIEHLMSLDPFDPNPSLSLTHTPAEGKPVSGVMLNERKEDAARPASSPARDQSSAHEKPSTSPGEMIPDDEAMDESEDGVADLSQAGSNKGRPHKWAASTGEGSSTSLPTENEQPGRRLPEPQPLPSLDFSTLSRSRAARRHHTFQSGRADELRPRPGQRFFNLIVWNDELHDYPSVMSIFMDVTPRSPPEAKSAVDEMDSRGRVSLATSTDVSDMLMAALQISGVNLGVSIRPAYDTFAEDVAAVLWGHLIDLASSLLFVGDGKGPLPPSAILRTILTDQLMRPWQHMYPISHDRMSPEFFNPADLRKIDGLLILESKLPKRQRMQLKDLLLVCMTTKETKKQITLRFMAMYASIMESFILREREEDLSISSMSVQVFTVSSMASMLVGSHGFLERLLAILRALMTSPSGTQGYGIILPPPHAEEADPTFPLFREQRCYAIYYALRYLLSSQGVQQQLVSEPSHLKGILDFFSLFTGISPDVRRVGEHLEFESEVWVPVFHVSSHLGRTAKLVGEAFGHSTGNQLVEAIGLVARAISNDWAAIRHRTNTLYRPLHMHEVNFGGTWFTIVQYDVSRDAVSFHHPMHWILAEMLRHVGLLSYDALQPLMSQEATRDTFPNGEEQHRQYLFSLRKQDGPGSPALANFGIDWQVILDIPLRVIVKIAQEHVGLWVRNGFALRSQAHHYRGSQMRSIMYNQDFFLLQFGFLALEERWLVAILDRFGVLDFVKDGDDSFSCAAFIHELTDANKLQMLDECLLLLVQLLTEASLCGGWSVSRQIRHELVHSLALGPGTYSEIIQGVSTRFVDHPAFEQVLADVAKFHKPTGVNGQGTYELKDICFQDVHPYFLHYSRNQREKAEEVLMERYKKTHAGPDGQLAPGRNLVEAWAARRLEVMPGTLFDSPRFLSTLLTPQFSSLLAGTIHVTRIFLGSDKLRVSETLIDSLLQLFSVGLACHGFAFVERLLSPLSPPSGACMSPDEANTSLLVLLCWLEGDDKLKSHRNKISWLLDQCIVLARSAQGDAGVERVNDLFRQGGKTVAAAENEAKERKRVEARRAAAKARQSAIMKKFSQQQQNLLKSFDEEGESSGTSGVNSGEEGTDDHNLHEQADNTTMSDAPTTHSSRPTRLNNDQVSLKYGSCILCQEGLRPDAPFGMLVHIQQSRTMRILPCADLEALGQSVSTPLTLDRGDFNAVAGNKAADSTHNPNTVWSKSPPRLRGAPAEYSAWPEADHYRPAGSFPPAFNRPGLCTTTCGHMMHNSCLESYCQSVDGRHQQQISRQAPENLSRLEIVCPLCKALGNTLLPLPDSHQCDVLDDQVDYTPDERTLPDWIRKVNIDILKWTKPIDLQESYTGSGTFKPWYADEPHGHLPTHKKTNKPLWEPTSESMLLRFLSVTRLQASDMKGLMNKMQQRTILALPSRRMYMPQDLVGYKLSMIEVFERGRAAKDGVVDQINDSTLHLLRGLLHALRLRAMLTGHGENAPEIIRQGLLKRLLPHWLTDDTVRSPLILRDPISILVEAAIIMPQELDHVITLMYYVNLVQLIFGLAQPCMWPPGAAGYTKYRNLFARRSAAATPVFPSQPQGPPEASPSGIDPIDVAAARQIFPDVRWTVANVIGLVGYARGNISLGVDHLEDDTLAKLLCTHTLPFLRRAAILRAAVFGSHTPTSVPRAETPAPETPNGETSEYMRLMMRLAIPLPSTALPARAERQTSLVGIIDGWIKHAYVPLISLFQPLPIQYSLHTPRIGLGAPHRLPGAPAHPILLLEHAGLYELVDLPDDLATLVQQTNQRLCQRCMKVPADPALCLLCGSIVCYQSHYSQADDGKRGECNMHTDECGGDVGLFFKIRTNVILALCKGNGTFIMSPYLDSHGEVDIGLRKGRSQHLDRMRYDDLRKQWLAHEIPTTVARKIEATHDPGGWGTF